MIIHGHSSNLRVELHEIEDYASQDASFPSLIPLSCIMGALARKVVSVGTPRAKAWATIAINSVRPCLAFLKKPSSHLLQSGLHHLR